MTHSVLVSYTNLSPNCTKPRSKPIDRITIHCVVGQLTAKQILTLPKFTTYDPKNGASCNYAVGTDGSIGLGVDEDNRSWCSSNRDNDMRAITIEVASDTKHPYAVNANAMDSLMALLLDIMVRHEKSRLIWEPDKEKALSYNPAQNEMLLTVHRWFENKACPGNYLYDLHPLIAEQITAALQPTAPDPWWKPWADWAYENGIADGTRPLDPVSRAETWVMLKRLYDKIKEEFNK